MTHASETPARGDRAAFAGALNQGGTCNGFRPPGESEVDAVLTINSPAPEVLSLSEDPLHVGSQQRTAPFGRSLNGVGVA